jgi:hypothetical protein
MSTERNASASPGLKIEARAISINEPKYGISAFAQSRGDRGDNADNICASALIARDHARILDRIFLDNSLEYKYNNTISLYHDPRPPDAAADGPRCCRMQSALLCLSNEAAQPLLNTSTGMS